MNCLSSSDLSLKYKRFPPIGCQDISIRKFEFVTKTQFLYLKYVEVSLQNIRRPGYKDKMLT